MKQFLLLQIIFLTGCNGCMQQLYGVNEAGYLNITFNDSKISGQYLKSYIDTVFNKGKKNSDSILGVFYNEKRLEENESLIHFKIFPEEWYLISFDAKPCWIKFIYKKDSGDMIRNKSQLNTAEIDRIENRFKSEIIEKAELFAKENNIPDSVAYEK